MIYGGPFKNVTLDFLKFSKFSPNRACECLKKAKIAEKWPNLDFGPPENGKKAKNKKIQRNVFVGTPIDHVYQFSAS